MKRYLAIWLPQWPIQRLLRTQPELEQKAVVVSRRTAQGAMVVACSPLAIAWGVRPGMPVAEAAAMAHRHRGMASPAQRQPSLQPAAPTRRLKAAQVTEGAVTESPAAQPLVPSRDPTSHLDRRSATAPQAASLQVTARSPSVRQGAHQVTPSSTGPRGASRAVETARSAAPAAASHLAACWHEAPLDLPADRDALEKLARWCHRFSPLVGLEEAPQPETLLLDLTGITPLFGGELALLDQVQRAFSRLHLEVRLGLGDTLGAAWASAHFGDTPTTPLPCLPVAALRLPDQTVSILEQLGLTRIGDLALLPRAEVQTRLGTTLLQRLDQAWGQAPELLQPVSPPPDFTVQWSFEFPVRHREPIEAACGQLIERICFLLQQQQQGALQIRCQLDCQSGPPVIVQFGLFQPSACSQHLLQLLDLQFQNRPLPDEVIQISLQVGQSGPLRWQQLELFDTAAQPDDTRQIATLIDRLSGRLGRDAVLQCTLRSDPQPECKTQYTPYHAVSSQTLPGTDRRRRQATTRTTSPASSLASHTARSATVSEQPQPPTQALPPRTTRLDSPLHLLAQPITLQVLAVAPDGPPLRFEYRGKQQQIVRHWGPERIETGWWRRPGIRRDYYRVETSTGGHFWLFRCLSSGTWFLHGSF